jgi:DNA-directed RNA polymerase subunit beta'
MSARFDCLKIKVASPKRIKELCSTVLPNGDVVGEVTSSETLNYDDFKPTPGGLFCERIFGPVKTGQCYCQKEEYSGENSVCGVCGVQITNSNVRRIRMGFIKLVSPVVHS